MNIMKACLETESGQDKEVRIFLNLKVIQWSLVWLLLLIPHLVNHHSP